VVSKPEEARRVESVMAWMAGPPMFRRVMMRRILMREILARVIVHNVNMAARPEDVLDNLTVAVHHTSFTL
jgi:hypothetical protein